ncbi:TPA: hypothetical protein DDZ86_01240 [Candidatus Dependentiae bacterium]|nr:MAG: hypothetical protein UW09_C0004G0129 [candidate division TM6 bacterium GW2011_GWF2_43_87]HBL98251.1 hypothetical protein [Candidatus Dependentiae bacterium]
MCRCLAKRFLLLSLMTGLMVHMPADAVRWFDFKLSEQTKARVKKASLGVFGFGALAWAGVRLWPHPNRNGSDHRAVKALGFDPCLTEYCKSGARTETAVVFAHGFGNQAISSSDERVMSDVYTGVVFEFADSRRFKPFGYRCANLGGEFDLRTLLYVLVRCREMGYKQIVLWGESRGGATVLRALHALTKPRLYEKSWRALGVLTESEDLDFVTIRELRKMVEMGRVILAQPLLSTHSVLRKMARDKVKCATPRCCHSLIGPVNYVGHVVIEAVFAALTNYNPFIETPLVLLKDLAFTSKAENPQFSIFMTLRDQDGVIGNELDDEVIKLSAKMKNKSTVRLMVVKDPSAGTGFENHTNVKKATKYLQLIASGLE